jgi:hypothetical protein
LGGEGRVWLGVDFLDGVGNGNAWRVMMCVMLVGIGALIDSFFVECFEDNVVFGHFAFDFQLDI